MTSWPLEADGGILKVCGDPQESGEDTFLSSKLMERRPLGSSEQFSGMISSEPDFSIMLEAGGTSRSISSVESDVTAAPFKDPGLLELVGFS